MFSIFSPYFLGSFFERDHLRTSIRVRCQATHAGSILPLSSTSGGSSAGQFDGMFGASGDLALQRKIEKPVVTIEKVEADPSDAVPNLDADNTVVTPQ